MKNSDIIIGQKYIHPRHPNTIYLGIGIQSHGGQRVEPALLILSGGNIHHTVVRSVANTDWWNEFQLMLVGSR